MNYQRFSQSKEMMMPPLSISPMGQGWRVIFLTLPTESSGWTLLGFCYLCQTLLRALFWILPRYNQALGKTV